MVSSDLHAVTARLDVLRDILIGLAAALPPDCVGRVVNPIESRLTQRLFDTVTDERSDDALMSDLVPLLAALRHPCGNTFDATRVCA